MDGACLGSASLNKRSTDTMRQETKKESSFNIDMLDLLDQQRWIKAILKETRAQFSETCKITKDFVETLCDRNVISTFNQTTLNESRDKDKADKLYQILERKGWENFKTARNILYGHNTSLSDLWDEKMVEEIPILQVKYQSPASEVSDNAFSKESEIPSTLPSYDDVQRRKRGICLVLHNIEFKGYNTRHGAKWDKLSIEKLFKDQLGFSFEYHENKSKAYILELLEQFIRYDKLKDYKCCVVIVMSHGKSESFICADDSQIKFEDVFRRFNGDKCPGLAGVPKWFIIQACRNPENSPKFQCFNKSVNLHDGLTESVCEIEKQISIPACADFYLSYSTAPGYYSYRDPNKGSWFIQTLCQVVEQYSSREDVGNMMTRVNKIVAHHFVHKEQDFHTLQQREVEVRQMPSHVHMLTGAFFLCYEARFRTSHGIPISSSLV